MIRASRTWTMRAGAVTVAAAAVLAPVAVSAPAMAAPAKQAQASPAGTYVIRYADGAAAKAAVLAAKGKVTRSLDALDTLIAKLPRGGADALKGNPAVLAVTRDAAVHLDTSSSTSAPAAYDAKKDPGSMYNVEKEVGAQTAYAMGITGKGIDVALIDSGIAPVAGLNAPGKVINGPDLTPESQNPQLRGRDTFGHGTHMAGIIAGHDTGVDPRKAWGNADSFIGMAPDARLVSVKVADGHGNTDVSQVIAGIDWVVQHAHDPGFNIRVLNLSFGTDSAQSYVTDPLAYAAEIAWRKGIVVVVSAGNSGTANGRLTDPAIDPYVIAVGASDRKTTFGEGDDTIPDFSSRGDGVRNPDVVAPGTHIQSLRVPGSYIDAQFASTGAINDRYFRGSVTSQAAAWTSGAIALALQYRPTLTPDQMKYLLTSTAMVLPAADKIGQGHGLVQLAKTMLGKTPSLVVAQQTFTPSSGTGSLDASRGSARLVLAGVTLNGEMDLHGQAFDAAAMAKAEAAGTAWSGGSWNGSVWAGDGWSADGTNWATGVWTSRTWAGDDWASRTWATGTWTGTSWADGSWNSRTWAGSDWDSRTWASRTWADGYWG